MAKKDDTAPAAAPAKFDAMKHVVDVLEPLEREDKREVLRAAAAYYGLVLTQETPR